VNTYKSRDYNSALCREYKIALCIYTRGDGLITEWTKRRDAAVKCRMHSEIVVNIYMYEAVKHGK
jgi:hypothetical protein